MKNTTFIGMHYEDAEGKYEVTGFKNDMAEVECIQEGNINEGKRFLVDPDEVLYEYFGWDNIVNWMDDEIREELHNEIAPCTDMEFLKEYSKRHLEKFGEEFTVE